MTPYEQGWHTEQIGKSIDENPYTSRLEKQERADWHKGWRESREEYNDVAMQWYSEAYF